VGRSRLGEWRLQFLKGAWEPVKVGAVEQRREAGKGGKLYA
jgi:hypothetical protein